MVTRIKDIRYTPTLQAFADRLERLALTRGLDVSKITFIQAMRKRVEREGDELLHPLRQRNLFKENLRDKDLYRRHIAEQQASSSLDPNYKDHLIDPSDDEEETYSRSHQVTPITEQEARRIVETDTDRFSDWPKTL